jgi:hypothetical protein
VTIILKDMARESPLKKQLSFIIRLGILGGKFFYKNTALLRVYGIIFQFKHFSLEKTEIPWI